MVIFGGSVTKKLAKNNGGLHQHAASTLLPFWIYLHTDFMFFDNQKPHVIQLLGCLFSYRGK